MSANEDVIKAKSMISGNSVMGMNKSWSSLVGSRFAHLKDIDEDEVEEMDAVKVDENDSRAENISAHHEPRSTEEKAKEETD